MTKLKMAHFEAILASGFVGYCSFPVLLNLGFVCFEPQVTTFGDVPGALAYVLIGGMAMALFGLILVIGLPFLFAALLSASIVDLLARRTGHKHAVLYVSATASVGLGLGALFKAVVLPAAVGNSGAPLMAGAAAGLLAGLVLIFLGRHPARRAYSSAC